MVLRRIERALGRLEAAAHQPRAEAAAGLAPDPPHETALAASNARLREAVAVSLRQIDALVARHGPDQPS